MRFSPNLEVCLLTSSYGWLLLSQRQVHWRSHNFIFRFGFHFARLRQR
nr:MAG TPA: hypothetical protein [Caudoviricetes sp.]